MSKSSLEKQALRRICGDPQIAEVADGICNHLKWVSVRSIDRRVRTLIDSLPDPSGVQSVLADRDQPADQLGRERLDKKEDVDAGDALDDPGIVDTPDESAVEQPPTIKLYDPGLAKKQLEGALPRSENSLEDYLQMMAVVGSEQRQLLVPPNGAADACRRFIEDFPNLAGATWQIAGAVYLAERKQLPIQLPQLLLDGPPGCGKTELIRRVAGVLELPLVTITMSAMRGGFELTGLNRTYRGGEPGRLIKSLLDSKVGNPVYLFDEAELAHDDHYGPLLSFLEDEWFFDTFLEMPFRTKTVNKIFITNYARRLPPTIQSRMILVAAMQPTREQMRTLVRKIYTDLLNAEPLFSDFSDHIKPAVIEALLKESLRGARTRLKAALYRAACRTPDASSLAIELRDLLPPDTAANYVFPGRRV